MPNNRIFWAIQYLAMKANVGTNGAAESVWWTLKGIQSVGMTTNFNLEQVFELGQLEIYENIENIPDVEITIEKALDGESLVYHVATQNAVNPTLIARAQERCTTALGIYPDNFEYATGKPTSQVECSGMYVSSLNYTFNTDGNFTESVTLVGNDKRWLNIPQGFAAASISPGGSGGSFGTDSPVGTGGINRREDFKWGTNPGSADCTILPSGIPGISKVTGQVGTNDNMYAHVARISVAADLRRDNIFELGRKGPYHRYVGFPVEVTTEIEVTSHSGDLINARSDLSTGCSVGNNLPNETIRICTCEGTRIWLGSKNKLSSVAYNGGDTGGANVTVTYTYIGYNTLNVLHYNDPNTTLRPASGNAQNNQLYLGAVPGQVG